MPTFRMRGITHRERTVRRVGAFALAGLVVAGAPLSAVQGAAPVAPTPTPNTGPGPVRLGPVAATPSYVGFVITLPHDGTVLAESLASSEGVVVSDFGIDQPSHQPLIADAGHHPGAFAVVGTYSAGTQLVMYITTTFNNTTYLSTGDHAHIIQDGTEAWNIGWEDWTDFDYDDVVTRICFQKTGTTGCALDADGSFGPGAPAGSGTNFVAYQAEPVNTATGNYTNQVADLQMPGRGLPFVFVRTYNSLNTAAGELGVGWSDTFSAGLELLPGGVVAFAAASGAQSVFIPDGQGGFAQPPGQRARLFAAGGGYDLTGPDQTRTHFDSAGVLQSVTDKNGNALVVGHAGGRVSQVTDSVGRVVTFSYDPTGHLSALAGPGGLSVAYAYDAAGRLATVTDVRGGTTTYAYDGSSRLATIADQNGHQLVQNTYGPDGRVAEQVDARGNHTTFTWDAATETSTMTDARGGQWVDRYAGGVLVSQRDPLGNLVQYGFTADRRIASVVDARGYEIDSAYG